MRGTAPIFLACLGLVPFGAAKAETPALSNVRNLALAGSSRASSTGTQAAFVNPAGVAFSSQFSTDAVYQYGSAQRSHALASAIHDSLNNPRVAVALTYAFMKAHPELRYVALDGSRQNLKLEHFGHEAAGVLGFKVVPEMVYLGASLKYQYTSLRYRDENKKGQQILPALKAFGLDLGAAFQLRGFARVTVVASNLLGHHRPAFDEKHPLAITYPNTLIINRTVSRVSDYPLTLAHGLALFPMAKSRLSINYDGSYDFTSYRKSQKWTRMTQGGGLEFIAGPVPLRVGARWDSMGKGSKDDSVFVGGGVAYLQEATSGNPGVELGIGVLQQVMGEGPLDTQIAATIAMRLHPNF